MSVTSPVGCVWVALGMTAEPTLRPADGHPYHASLGEEGEGFTIAMRCLQPGRVTVAAKALGVARACFEDAVGHAQSRELRASRSAGSRWSSPRSPRWPPPSKQAGALVYTAAQHLDAGLPSNRIAALAKFHASQTAKLVADKAQQIFGGYGMATDYRVS